MFAIGAFTSLADGNDGEAPGTVTLGALALVGRAADSDRAMTAALSSAEAGLRSNGGHSIGTTLMVRIDSRTLCLGMICVEMHPDVKTERRTIKNHRFIVNPHDFLYTKKAKGPGLECGQIYNRSQKASIPLQLSPLPQNKKAAQAFDLARSGFPALCWESLHYDSPA